VYNLNLAEIALNAANGDEEAIVVIIKKFMPTILKFSRELNYEEAETDLIIGLLEKLPKISSKIVVNTHEGVVVNYIYQILKNKKIDLFRKYIVNVEKEILNDEILDLSSYIVDFNQKMEIDGYLSKLTEKQKKIILLRYYHGFSDAEVAERFNISRQSVNKIHRRALEKLKDEYNILN
jgi:RNA polymerase sigma factor (sigma-70 family)